VADIFIAVQTAEKRIWKQIDEDACCCLYGEKHEKCVMTSAMAIEKHKEFKRKHKSYCMAYQYTFLQLD
jgi:hypothetical protein